MEKGDIAENLREIRKEKSFTQKELADNFEFSEVQISNIERNKSNPHTKTLVNMANSFDVPLSKIVDKSYSTNIDIDIEEYERRIGSLSDPKTLLILKMLEKIKEELREYNTEYLNSKDKEYAIAEELDYRAVGESIAKLRKKKNLDQHTMSKRMFKRSGMKEGTYRNIENNNGTASIESYMEIANELDVPIDYIFDKSLHNKEAVSIEYIKSIFDDTDEKEEDLLKQLAGIMKVILDSYYEDL